MTVVQSFLRQMQWRSTPPLVPEPVVALLGPRGSGKSRTLRDLSAECGGTIVHADLDFAEHPDLDLLPAVAFVAFSLMREWTNLGRRPVFHRLGLSLLALNERLDPDYHVAQEQVKRLIRQYVQRLPAARAGEHIAEPLFTAAELAAAVGGIAVPDAVHAIERQTKPVIATLFRGAARWGLRDAMRWHHMVPEAQDADTISSLIALSTRHRSHAPVYVMKALLADIEEFTRRHPPARSSCDCDIPADTKSAHEHVWFLLLDNVESAVGGQFLDSLITARQERAAGPPNAGRSDPLLVVAAISQWRSSWGPWWREPWQTATATPDKQPVPVFSRADRGQWTRHATDKRVHPARGWYPVWLDAASGDAPGAPVPLRDRTDLDTLVARLAAGHPAAALAIEAEVGIRDATAGGEGPILDVVDEHGVPLWARALDASQPRLAPAERPWRGSSPAVGVAARLSDPARRTDHLPADLFPDATQALRDLRSNLWVSTFAARPSPLWRVGRGSEEPPAALHPWLSRCLLAGFAAGSETDPSAWDDVFAAVFDAEPDPTRALFRDLAQGRFTAVVKELVGLFDTVDHRVWVRTLDDVTGAPCRLPHREPFAVSYRQLCPDRVPGRAPVEAAITSLTALLWLYRDPLSVPGALRGGTSEVPWHRQVCTDFHKLVHGSGQSDVLALEEAAAQFESLP